MASLHLHVTTTLPRMTVRNQTDKPGPKLDRRNVLIGIGAANLVYPNSPATAEPIPPPDMNQCSRGTDLNTSTPLTFDCCPPKPSPPNPRLYRPDFSNTKLRIRPAAQSVTPEYLEKLQTAVKLMKALPDDDPRSFRQQANVHCAYCNLTYNQTPNSDIKLQIHFCWHFYPWHRWYLFFYERILGKLIGDPEFAIPFWNWDNLPGMIMPAIFTNRNTPLYNENRDPNHYPPAIANLLYSGTETTDSPITIIKNNLAEMYKEIITNGSTLTGFYGERYVVGTEPRPGAGSVEIGSHTALHRWVGTRTREGYDMGNFSTASRDPIFYGHHANIDRLWTEWRSIRERKKKQSIFNEADWLKAEYLFYNEDKELVRVNVEDSIDEKKLGYTYQKVLNPWLENRPLPRTKKSRVVEKIKLQKKAQTIFPVKLDKVVKVLVDRPKKRRGKKEKEEEEEVLEIEGIKVDSETFVRFEVFVNDEDDKPEELIANSEYVGGFSVLPQKFSSKMESKLRLGLTEVLEDLDIEDDEKILVSVVPRAGGAGITIGGIKIFYAS